MISDIKIEFEENGQIYGWTTDEIMNMPDEPHGAIFRLMLKFVNGNTNLQEEVALEIDKLLSNNNVDHISLKAIMEKSQEIIELIKTS
jgi:hypothetical protein